MTTRSRSEHELHAETPDARSPAVAAAPVPAPVPPSPMVRRIMGPMTKVLNPLIRRLAGRRHVPMIGQIHHTGRRSGRTYVTPVGIRVLPDGRILIPLTFGNQSDWARNVRAAGICTVRINGRDHPARAPRFADAADPEIRALIRTFYRRQRPMLRALGITQFLLLEPAPPR
jgi:deazaflavin-dependent oxidoreductase (nitroreductase family)